MTNEKKNHCSGFGNLVIVGPEKCGRALLGKVEPINKDMAALKKKCPQGVVSLGR